MLQSGVPFSQSIAAVNQTWPVDQSGLILPAAATGSSPVKDAASLTHKENELLESLRKTQSKLLSSSQG